MAAVVHNKTCRCRNRRSLEDRDSSHHVVAFPARCLSGRTNNSSLCSNTLKSHHVEAPAAADLHAGSLLCNCRAQKEHHVQAVRCTYSCALLHRALCY
jgi:hypothetical protein